MPLHVETTGSTIFIRRDAFESNGLERGELDQKYNLTDAELRVEEALVAIGPLTADEDLRSMLDYLEAKGLVYFDDYFELSGNWPAWLGIFVRSANPERR